MNVYSKASTQTLNKKVSKRGNLTPSRLFLWHLTPSKYMQFLQTARKHCARKLFFLFTSLLWICQFHFLKASRTNFNLQTESHIIQEIKSQSKTVQPPQSVSLLGRPVALPSSHRRTETKSCSPPGSILGVQLTTMLRLITHDLHSLIFNNIYYI